MRSPEDDSAKVDLKHRQFFVEDLKTGSFRFTQRGLDEYRARFRKAGIDIHAIRNKTAFKDALRNSWSIELQAIVAEVRRRGRDPIETNALIAALTGNDAECERLEKILVRRNRLGLKLL